jgi:hypothetical protein
MPSALNKAVAVAAELLPCGPDAHFLAGKLAKAADLGTRQDVNLLRCEPLHELEVISRESSSIMRP